MQYFMQFFQDEDFAIRPFGVSFFIRIMYLLKQAIMTIEWEELA